MSTNSDYTFIDHSFDVIVVGAGIVFRDSSRYHHMILFQRAGDFL